MQEKVGVVVYAAGREQTKDRRFNHTKTIRPVFALIGVIRGRPLLVMLESLWPSAVGQAVCLGFLSENTYQLVVDVEKVGTRRGGLKRAQELPFSRRRSGTPDVIGHPWALILGPVGPGDKKFLPTVGPVRRGELSIPSKV